VSPGPITRRRYLAAAAAGTVAAGAAAREAEAAPSPTSMSPLIPRRVLFAAADRAVARVSPDGRRLASWPP
jgi:hypothetical protein